MQRIPTGASQFLPARHHERDPSPRLDVRTMGLTGARGAAPRVPSGPLARLPRARRVLSPPSPPLSVATRA
eukprot:1427816-Prymnesium_polylepis.1